jgi:hypothetical protein
MSAKNLFRQREISPYRMDKNSDRFRICPNDNVAFMAIHRSEKFCCHQCADEFHNQKKRLEAEKQLEDEINEALNAAIPRTDELTLSHNQSDEVTQTSTALVTSSLVGNIHLIGATLGNRQFLKVYKNYLTDKGLDFGVYDHKYRLPGTELYVLTYGPYAIAWGYEDYIILTYKKNIPWIQ